MKHRAAALILLVVLVAGVCAVVWMTGTDAIARAPRQHFEQPAKLPIDVVSLEGEPELVGWAAERSGSCGAVVLLHGRGSDKTGLVERARLFFDAGYSVLMFDLSGHGESSGDRRGFGYTEGNDAGRILAYARQRFPDRRIAAVGQSLGAAAFVFAAPAARADAYVLEQLYATLSETTALRAPLPVLRGLQASILLAQMPLRLGYRADDVRPVDRIGTLEMPTLLLAGTADPFVDTGQSERLLQASAWFSDLRWFEGAGHVDLLRRDPAKYRAEVLAFLQRELCKT